MSSPPSGPPKRSAPETSFIVAAVQMAPRLGDVAGNVERSCRWIELAADHGAALVVLPEMCAAGYVFTDRAEAWRHAEEVPAGPATSAWMALAARRRTWIIAGVAERDGARLYNSAVLVSPDGYLGTFRKAHLWNDEKRIYDRNTTGFPAFDTRLGCIALGICYDAWFPETFRSAALQGADVIVLPSNWVPVPGQQPGLPAMANLMCITGAHSNQLYVVAASRVGTERGQQFLGRSVIVGPDGWLLAGPASASGEEMILARIDPMGSRAARQANPFNQPLRDRRPDLYRLEA